MTGTSVLENMYKLLRPMKLYRLDGQSLISCELAAYAAALDRAKQRLDQMLSECFIATAGEEGLAALEALFGLPEQQALSYGDRRSMLMSLFSMQGEDSTKQGIENSLKGIGLYAEIEEDPENERIDVFCHKYRGKFTGHNMLALRAEKVLPAHLSASLHFDFSLQQEYV